MHQPEVIIALNSNSYNQSKGGHTIPNKTCHFQNWCLRSLPWTRVDQNGALQNSSLARRHTRTHTHTRWTFPYMLHLARIINEKLLLQLSAYYAVGQSKLYVIASGASLKVFIIIATPVSCYCSFPLTMRWVRANFTLLLPEQASRFSSSLPHVLPHFIKKTTLIMPIVLP